MDKEEVKEWLGVTKADLMMYIAFFLVIVALFTQNIMLFTVTFFIAIILGVYSTVLGTPRRKEFSKVTNIAKKITYPLCLLILILVIIGKYIFWFFC